MKSAQYTFRESADYFYGYGGTVREKVNGKMKSQRDRGIITGVLTTLALVWLRSMYLQRKFGKSTKTSLKLKGNEGATS